MYNGSGDFAWVRAGESTFAQARDVAVDGSGRASVVGRFSDFVSFAAPGGPITLTAPQFTLGVFLATFAADGTIAWATAGTTENGFPDGWSVAVDGSRVVIGGEFSGESITFGAGRRRRHARQRQLLARRLRRQLHRGRTVVVGSGGRWCVRRRGLRGSARPRLGLVHRSVPVQRNVRLGRRPGRPRERGVSRRTDVRCSLQHGERRTDPHRGPVAHRQNGQRDGAGHWSRAGRRDDVRARRTGRRGARTDEVGGQGVGTGGRGPLRTARRSTRTVDRAADRAGRRRDPVPRRDRGRGARRRRRGPAVAVAVDARHGPGWTAVHRHAVGRQPHRPRSCGRSVGARGSAARHARSHRCGATSNDPATHCRACRRRRCRRTSRSCSKTTTAP